jgi:predicted RNase H-like HicB family nuclease
MADQAALSEPLSLHVELEEESETGRWIADVTNLPGVLAYGATAFEAIKNVKVLAIAVVGERLENGEDLLTGHELGEANAPDEAAAAFAGIEFHHATVAS